MQLSFSLSNLKNVQLNTDVFSDTQRYLYTKEFASIKSIELKRGGVF